MQQDVTGLLYVCGHPGQGKTAVVNQVLFDYFGDMDSSFGGIHEDLFVLKYNAMRYTTPVHFVESLLTDLNSLTAKSIRRNFIKSLSYDRDSYKGSLPSAQLSSKKKSTKKRSKTTAADKEEKDVFIPMKSIEDLTV